MTNHRFLIDQYRREADQLAHLAAEMRRKADALEAQMAGAERVLTSEQRLDGRNMTPADREKIDE